MDQNTRSGEILNQKYKLIEVIGEGGTGTTYSAIALDTEQPVAIKNLSLRGLDNWKQIELFEREAKILATLNHPAIPKYLDYFCIDSDDTKDFYIVQQLARGKSLYELVKDGWRTTEAEIKSIAEQILEILVYLHGLVPAVVHRDIKPQNLIRSDEGKIFLVDFGAVQNTYYTNLKQGSTVVGTYGFMAPEQFRGQAVVATDLYNLGATIVYLLTHCPPAELPHKNLKIDFRDRVRVSHQFATWLDKLIEPNIEQRFESADSALAELRSQTFAARESFKKLFQTQLNMATVGLIAITTCIASIGLISFVRTEENKIRELEKNKLTELEKNPIQLCNDLDLAQHYVNEDGNPNLIVRYKNTESNLLFCLLNNANNQSKNTAKFLQTIELLIDAGADLKSLNNQNQTPLLFWLSKTNRHYIRNNKILIRKAANLLIDRGAEVNVRDSDGNSPLLLAMSYHLQDTRLARQLIDQGALINVNNQGGDTPLSLSIERNYWEFTNFLLSKGADYNIVDRHGKTLLFKAAAKSRSEIVSLLLNKGIDPNVRSHQNQTAIFKLVENPLHAEKQAILELLVANEAEIDIKDKYNRSLLSYLASDRDISAKTIKYLLNKGLEINTIDDEGYTPLSYAANTNNWQTAKVLIENGAEIDIKVALNGLTPIFKAVHDRNLEITKLLLDNKADITLVDNQGNNLLMMTHNQRHGINKEIFDLLIEQGLDINAQNKKGDTLLALFIDNNYYQNNQLLRYKLQTIEYLINKGADVNIKDSRGRSILLKANYHGEQEIAELLRKYGAKH